MNNFGVISCGIKMPIIREGDNLVDIILSNINDFEFNDNDVLGITESVIARAAGQYISVDDIANDIINKFGENSTITLLSPIYSRNRFSLILKGIARGCKKINCIMPDYDEVGNPKGLNPFTNVNIETFYRDICLSENCAFNVQSSLYYYSGLEYDNIIDCRLHLYAKHINNNHWYSLADICDDKSPDWGLLGTNKASDEILKLFPSKNEIIRVCDSIKKGIKKEKGVNVIVMCYGDGCFHSPYLFDDNGCVINGTSINEFADPVAWFSNPEDSVILNSTPKEIKIKYFADNTYRELNGKDLTNAIKKEVKKRNKTPKNSMNSEGCTPRHIGDLLASLMDLTSGSGSKGTPCIWIQNYFNDFSS